LTHLLLIVGRTARLRRGGIGIRYRGDPVADCSKLPRPPSPSGHFPLSLLGGRKWQENL